MLKLVVNNKTEEEELFQPLLKTGGKGPPQGYWLSPMKSGTEFLTRGKTMGQPKWLLNEWTHCGKMKGNVLICPTSSLNNPTTWIWVDPIEFCRVFELRAILEIPKDDDDEHN